VHRDKEITSSEQGQEKDAFVVASVTFFWKTLLICKGTSCQYKIYSKKKTAYKAENSSY